MYNAREVGPQDGPELYGMVQELCRRANLPMPKCMSFRRRRRTLLPPAAIRNMPQWR